MRVLDEVETGFYLTGGTAASRGYLNHRFSDDLDLFVNDDDRFSLWAERPVFDEPRIQRLLNEARISTSVDGTTLATLAEAGVVAVRLTAADVDFLRHWGIFKPHVRFEAGQLLVDGSRIPADLNNDDAYRRICRSALGDSLAHGVIMHGGFFLGPADFYQALRDMPRADAERMREAIRLYGPIPPPNGIAAEALHLDIEGLAVAGR